MERYIINGGKRLCGKVKLSGAKNAVLPIMAAAVLCKDECIIKNCPDISDVRITKDILKSLGHKVKTEDNALIIGPVLNGKADIDRSFVEKIRSSVIFMGAVLSKYGEVKISYPGGCKIGKRPIDLHLSSLEKMGAEIEEDGCFINCKGKLKGADIYLPCPSVGATENIMIAACCTKGTTTIHNAAREPEICDLANFINCCGGRVSGAGGETIIIEGVESLSGCEYCVMPDRIEAGTFISACCLSGGNIVIENIKKDLILSFLTTFEKIGCIIENRKYGLFIGSPKKIHCCDIVTKPHPGFPTDMQPAASALLTVSDGISIIEENVFEDRFQYMKQLIKMGADIEIKKNKAFIRPVNKLFGCDVTSEDLRGGAALVCAALYAQGKTCVHDNGYIERGYENIVGKLKNIGADIEIFR